MCRVRTLETDVQATRQLLTDCDINGDTCTPDTASDLETTIQEAHNMLRSVGFLPPLRTAGNAIREGCWCEGAEARDQVRGEPATHTQDCLDRRKDGFAHADASGRGRCLCNDGDEVDYYDVQRGYCLNCEEKLHYGDDSFLDCLNDVRRAREEFWAGLAVSGHVET